MDDVTKTGEPENKDNAAKTGEPENKDNAADNSMTVDTTSNQQQQPPQTDVPEFNISFVPQEYRDKPYMKDINSFDDLFKKLDGAETLVGKKIESLPEDATDEQFNKFYSAIGRPKDEKEYEVVGVKEGEEPVLFDAMRPAFLEAGMNQAQVKRFTEKAMKQLEELAKQQGIDKKKMDDEFEQMVTEAFGTRKEMVLENGRKLISQFTPDKMKEYLENIDNNSLVLLAGVLDGIRKQYISETDITDQDISGISDTAESVREEARKFNAMSIDTQKYNINQRDQFKKKAQELYQKYENLTKKRS